MATLEMKYKIDLQDCKDTIEAYHKLCQMVNEDEYYAEAYRNLLWTIHSDFFQDGLKNPSFILDLIMQEYVMTFDEYVDKKYSLFSDCCHSDFFDDYINQYIDYEAILQDDDDVINLVSSYPLYDTLVFDWYLFEDDYICETNYNSSSVSMEELFKYKIGDNDDL